MFFTPAFWQRFADLETQFAQQQKQQQKQLHESERGMRQHLPQQLDDTNRPAGFALPEQTI
jgi:hypothetical protein